MSILAKFGYNQLAYVDGGMDKLIALNTEVLKAKCPKSGVWKKLNNKTKFHLFTFIFIYIKYKKNKTKKETNKLKTF